MWAELSRGEGRPAAAADGAAPACGRRNGPNRGNGQEKEKPPIMGMPQKAGRRRPLPAAQAPGVA